MIYIAPRGILEIYHLSIKHRLGALLFNPNGLLLYHLTSFSQAKENDGDPAHIFLCDHSNHPTHKKRDSQSSMSSFLKPRSINEVDLDSFDGDNGKRSGSVMYELKVRINHEALEAQRQKNGKTPLKNGKSPNRLSAGNVLSMSPVKSTGSTGSYVSIGRVSPITFIHPNPPRPTSPKVRAIPPLNAYSPSKAETTVVNDHYFQL